MKRLMSLLAVAAMSMCGSAFAMDPSAYMMKIVDTNKDGKVSMAENDAYSKKIFRMMDTNRDSSLTSAEMEAGHRVMMERYKMDADRMQQDEMKKDPGMNH